VVIHQLPVVEETLWLRVLGRGNVQKQAVEELVELPTSNPYKENLLEILANWRQNLELRDNLTNDEQEDIMNLSPAYLKQREDWKLEGKQEEAASLVLRQLARRFGEIPQNLAQQIRELPIDDIEALGEALLDFQSLSDMVNWLGR
jgi:hypothetical protein